MAQLQFRSDDTEKWIEQYGNFSDGDATPSGTFGNAKTTFTGTASNKTGTVGSNSGFAIGDIVAIFQMRNGGDNVGDWQLNKITDISGTTFTFKYNLTHNYATTGQIIKVNQNRDVTFSGGTLTVPAWNGSTGGVAILMGNKLSGNGSIVGTGANGTQTTNGRPSGGGFIAGQQNDSQHTTGFRGEGTGGAGNDRSTSANGTGGGGGGSPSGTNKSHGAGGGNGTAGQNGNNGATGGSTGGNAELTIIIMGGSGGSGCGGDNSNAGSGGNGGAIVILIFRTLDLSSISINLDGGQGVNGNVGAGASEGGNGAGGSCLLKGEKLTLGTGISAMGATGGNGGDGGNGRVHADYALTISGTTNPTLDSRQDKSLLKRRGGVSLIQML